MSQLLWLLDLQNRFAGGVWKSWGMSAREAPEFCKLTLVDNCSGGSEEQMLKEAKTVKTVLVTVALRRTQGKQESSREMG